MNALNYIAGVCNGVRRGGLLSREALLPGCGLALVGLIAAVQVGCLRNGGGTKGTDLVEDSEPVPDGYEYHPADDLVSPDQRGEDVPVDKDQVPPVDTIGDLVDAVDAMDVGKDLEGDTNTPDGADEVDTASCTPGTENTEELCSDNCSNDGDPYIDCDDYECDCTVACGGTGCSTTCTPGTENTEELCSDTCSNDEDPYVDCDDYDCSCTVACGGTGCSTTCTPGTENTEELCSDNCSNDGDAFIDCDDYDCDCTLACGGTGCSTTCTQGTENTEELCSDNCSNDGDPYIDCDDYDCDCALICGGGGC